MKWTTLRLNMLPITAVQVEYACETLTNLHNALVDAFSKQSINFPKNSNKSKPVFTSSQNFLPVTIQKSSIPLNQLQSHKMTYDKLIIEYEKLKIQIQSQIHQLNKFYVKHSHDSSASLFHMLRLRLERVLFDCNTDKNQLKKVMTIAQQEKQYKEIAKQFQSKTSKTQPINNPKISSNQKYLESWDTFKTQNYAGYENQSVQISQNQFLELENQNYQKLNFDLKPQSKKYISQNNVKSQSKSKSNKSLSPLQKNQKSNNLKTSNSKTLVKKQPTSQITIATENDKQKVHIQTKQPKANLTGIQNNQNSYTNLKILTNNNISSKTTQRTQIQAKIPKQAFSNSYHVSNKVSGTQKPISANQKAKGYAVLNQKKEQQKRKNVNENQTIKSNSFIKVQNTQNAQIIANPKMPSQITQGPSPKKTSISDKSKNNIEAKKQSPIKSPIKEQKQLSDLKQILISNGSQLRFTIKMSRQEYKSLLELKKNMGNKSS